MVQIKKGDPHGCARIQVALVSTTGRAYGTAGPSAADNTTSGAFQITDPKNCTLPAPDRNTINFTGGNRWLGAFQYGIDALGSFQFTTQAKDFDLNALLTGGAVDQTTNTLWTYGAPNTFKDELPQVCMLVTWRLQARGTNEGASVFITTIIPRAWIYPAGESGAPSFQSPGEVTYTVTPTASTVLPHGLSISDMVMTQELDKVWRTDVVTDNAIGLCTYVGDGSTVVFTLPFLPLSAVVTVNASPNELVIDGTLTAASSVVPATGVVTFSVAPASAGHTAIFYETAFLTA